MTDERPEFMMVRTRQFYPNGARLTVTAEKGASDLLQCGATNYNMNTTVL